MTLTGARVTGGAESLVGAGIGHARYAGVSISKKTKIAVSDTGVADTARKAETMNGTTSEIQPGREAARAALVAIRAGGSGVE